MLRERRRKEKKQRKREKKQRMLEQIHRERQEIKQQEVLIIDAPSDYEQDQDDPELSPVKYNRPTVPQPMAHAISPEKSKNIQKVSQVQYSRSPIPKPMAHAVSPEKSKNIQTVDLSQLGDLFSVPVSHPALSSGGHTVISVQTQPAPQYEDTKIFAKKSVPAASKLSGKSLAEQVESAPIFILPDQVQGMTAVTSIANMTIKSGQEIPIIDCRPMLSGQYKQEDMSGMIMTEYVDNDEDDSVDDPTYEPIHEEKVTIHVTEQQTHSPQMTIFKPETKVHILSSTKISNSLLKRHSGIPSVPCPHCPKLFMRGYNMRVHIDRVHNKTKPWQCQYCSKTFATTSDLKQHLSSHGMGKIHKVLNRF